MTTERSTNESYRNFESRSNAQLARFDSPATGASISESIFALMLLSNAAVESSQRVSILASAAPSSSIVNSYFFTNDLLKLVHYESVATILRQCDNQRVNDPAIYTISSSFANVPNTSDKPMKRQSNNQTNKMIREQMANAKKNLIFANAVVSSVIGTAITMIMGPYQMTCSASTHLFSPMIVIVK